MNRECKRCKKTLPVENFYTAKKKDKIYWHSTCKSCFHISPNIMSEMLHNAKKRANKKKVAFNLTKDFLGALNISQKGNCALTGIALNWDGQSRAKKKGASPFDRASLDRIDPSKGYTEDNVQLVADFVNRMKYQLTEDELLAACRLIVEHYEKRKREVLIGASLLPGTL